MKKVTNIILRLLLIIQSLVMNLIEKLEEKSQLMRWAEREVQIACNLERSESGEGPGVKKKKWDYGCSCHESALRALRSLSGDGHSGMSIQFTQQTLNRLIEWKPLTPVEDGKDDWNVCTWHDNNGDSVYQHKRMSALFKRVTKEGKISYSDNDYTVCIDMRSGSRYHGSLAHHILHEIIPITMPYYPTKPIKVYVSELLTDAKNGDFDTVLIDHAIKPNGDRIEINRQFKEPSSPDDILIHGWVEISDKEWSERLVMDAMRKINLEKEHPLAEKQTL